MLVLPIRLFEMYTDQQSFFFCFISTHFHVHVIFVHSEMSAQEITDGAFKAYSPDCSKDTNELLFRIITSNDDDGDKKIIPYIYTSPFQLL